MSKLQQLNSLLRPSKVLQTSGCTHVPLPTGPLKNVAFRDFLLGHSRQTGLLVRLFYPTASELPQDTKRWPKWLPHEQYAQGMMDVAGVTSSFLSAVVKAINPLANKYVPLIENGPFLKPTKDSKYPLLVFSHGLGGFRSINTTFCLEFVSQGFVVAAVEHRDNSAALSFYYRQKNGSSAIEADNEQHFEPEIVDPKYRQPRPLQPVAIGNEQEQVWIRHRMVTLLDHSPNACTFRNRQVIHRAGECSRAVDFLDNLNSNTKVENILDTTFDQTLFENALDLEKIAIMGHSMGGATTILSAIRDSRFKVAVGLDAWAFPLKHQPLDSIPQPLLLINAETLGTEKHNVRKFSEIFKNADHVRKQAVTITGSTHMQQCDAPFVFSRLMRQLIASVEPKKATLDTLDVHDLTSAKALQFIRKYLQIQESETTERFLRENESFYRQTYP